MAIMHIHLMLEKLLHETKKLLDVTKQSLYEGIRNFKAGKSRG